MSKLYTGGIVAALALVLLGSASFYTVPEGNAAVVLRLGKVDRTVAAPAQGLHVQWPWPIEQAVIVSQQVQASDLPGEDIALAEGQKASVSTLLRWHVTDAGRFYNQIGADGDAQAELSRQVTAALHKALDNKPLDALLTEDRAGLEQAVRNEVSTAAKNAYGIALDDLRFRRIDLPAASSAAVFSRMSAERSGEAAAIRADGEAQYAAIKADADRDAVAVRAEAQSKADLLRGDADRQAIDIYAAAYGRDPQFYAFYRSMQAYRTALAGSDTTLLLTPDSPFLRYLDGPGALQK